MNHPVRAARKKVHGDEWVLYHFQLGEKIVKRGNETPLCGPLACNVYCKLLSAKEEDVGNFCNLAWYDNLSPQDPIKCRKIMVLTLKDVLPMFIISESQKLAIESAGCTDETGKSTSCKLNYAAAMLGMKDDLFENILGEKGDKCPICNLWYQESHYVFICVHCDLTYHPHCFVFCGFLLRQGYGD